MSNTKHTKGPWFVTKYGDLQYAISNNPNGYEEREIPAEEDEANAKIISSAPDLLEALIEYNEAMKHFADVDYQHYDKKIIAEAKIRLLKASVKAEGAINKATS
jgi:hypothetical protein